MSGIERVVRVALVSLQFVAVAGVYRAMRKYDAMGLAALLRYSNINPWSLPDIEAVRAELNRIDKDIEDGKAKEALISGLVRPFSKKLKVEIDQAHARLKASVDKKFGGRASIL